jgi:hypothetical protein
LRQIPVCGAVGGAAVTVSRSDVANERLVGGGVVEERLPVKVKLRVAQG